MPRITRPAAIVVVAIGLWVPVGAFIQDRTSSGVPIRWNLASGQPNISNGQVEYVINKRGSEDVAFSEVVSAVEAAFNQWRLRNGSLIDFISLSDPSPLAEGTLPNPKDQVNVVYWDEDPRRGFMIPVDGIGITFRDADPNSGHLNDADIVLNGYQFLWTSQADGNFSSLTGPVDIQEALTAAVGGFIGLNRVPTAGSVMQEGNYPGDIFRTSLTSDELAAVLDLYPPTPNPDVTSISGRVTRSAVPVFGAYVAAFQSGVPVVGAISDPNGFYSIRRIPAGSYSVRAMTLRAPFGSLFYAGIDPNFQSEVFLNSATDPGSAVTAIAGIDTPLIDLDVASSSTADPWEPDNDMANAKAITPNGPRQIHHTFPASDLDFVKFTATVGRLYVVETSNLGSGLADSDTVLDLVSSPTPSQNNNDSNAKQKSRTSRLVFRAAASGPHFVRAMQASSVSGSGTAYDISVIDLGTTALTPIVSSVTPSQGSQGGGYQVSVFGSNFMPGAGVSFGGLAGTEVDVAAPRSCS